MFRNILLCGFLFVPTIASAHGGKFEEANQTQGMQEPAQGMQVPAQGMQEPMPPVMPQQAPIPMMQQAPYNQAQIAQAQGLIVRVPLDQQGREDLRRARMRLHHGPAVVREATAIENAWTDESAPLSDEGSLLPPMPTNGRWRTDSSTHHHHHHHWGHHGWYHHGWGWRHGYYPGYYGYPYSYGGYHPYHHHHHGYPYYYGGYHARYPYYAASPYYSYGSGVYRFGHALRAGGNVFNYYYYPRW